MITRNLKKHKSTTLGWLWDLNLGLANLVPKLKTQNEITFEDSIAPFFIKITKYCFSGHIT